MAEVRNNSRVPEAGIETDFPSGLVFPIRAAVDLPKAAGGKARGLRSIASAGLRVPDSWVVLPGAATEELRDLIEELRRRGHGLLVVRSSARDEDGERASFAGIHLSLLGVTLDELMEAVPRVSKSPLSVRAKAYRKQLGLLPLAEACAAVVQSFASAPWKERPKDAVLRGDGVSPGVAEGLVCVLHSPLEGLRLAPGEILVAPTTEPAWTPLFARAAGVVVELGGLLSHSGIVAREYGIPCVANVGDATRALRDGDRVHIDGDQGVVSVVSRTGMADGR